MFVCDIITTTDIGLLTEDDECSRRTDAERLAGPSFYTLCTLYANIRLRFSPPLELYYYYYRVYSYTVRLWHFLRTLNIDWSSWVYVFYRRYVPPLHHATNETTTAFRDQFFFVIKKTRPPDRCAHNISLPCDPRSRCATPYIIRIILDIFDVRFSGLEIIFKKIQTHTTSIRKRCETDTITGEGPNDQKILY